MIEFKNVYKTYPNGFTALKNINLQIEQGEFVAIIGLSGAGKSTILRCINRMHDISKGELTVDGVTVDSLRGKELRRYRRKVGMIFQSFNLVSRSTAIKNVLTADVPDMPFFRVLLGIFTKRQKMRALESLDKVGILDKAYTRCDQLSGGQQQRVAIARALATRPKYLLCDEATSALDPNTTQSILRLLKEINQTLGVTIVVITHEMRVIEQICQRVAVIDQSCIAEMGNVSDVFTHPKSDIAKALILPKSPAENLPPCAGKRLRLVFDGSCSNEPVISRITLECHVPVNILFADTRIVEGSIYGHMVIDLPDDPQQFHDVLRWLDHNHISYLQED